MASITYIESNETAHEIEVPSGLSVMEGALRNGVPGIEAECGGSCSCATCHVYVAQEWLARIQPPSDLERSMLEFAVEVADNSRLSCQIKVSDALDGLVVRIPASQF